jgi:hypothetical protein
MRAIIGVSHTDGGGLMGADGNGGRAGQIIETGGGWIEPGELLAWQTGRIHGRWELAGVLLIGLAIGYAMGARRG